MKVPLLFRFLLFIALAASTASGTVTREPGPKTSEGGQVEIFTLTNAHRVKARVMSWGATLIEVTVPDRDGHFADVTLGFDRPEQYLAPHPFFGSIAGRYANRIAKGLFTLEGQAYRLAVNNGPNHLHGGLRGFDKRLWQGEPKGDDAVRFSYTSADGEEGYPGTLKVEVTYRLTDRNELRLDYSATTDRPTVLNLTNHTYWNLAGSPDVLAHELKIDATRYTVVTPDLIPTGELRPVAGTPLDFTKSKPIGRDIEALDGPGQPDGYDHNYVLEPSRPGELALAAEVRAPAVGRTMRVFTTQPGVQFYTANHLEGVTGKAGRVYGPRAGFCLETQHFPDSPNQPTFPSTELRPGETFLSTTVYEFSVQP